MKMIMGKDFNFSNKGLMGILGNEGFGNLLDGGMKLYNGMQMGDMLDFQKGMAKNADRRTESLFQQDKREQEALNNLNFA